MKKRVGSYKGKPIVEGGGENTLTKNELTTNSFGGSNKYKGEYYRVKEEYQRGYIKNFFKNFFYEGICQTESSYGTYNLESIDDTSSNDMVYEIFYVKFSPVVLYSIVFTTLKDYIMISGEGEKAWNIISTTIEPCTEEEYYSHFPKTKDDII